MRYEKILLSAALLLACCGVSAQTAPAAEPFGIERGQTPAMEVGANFVFVHANAPPAACGCFSLYGGGGTLVVNAPRGLSLVLDMTGTHANKVDGTTQHITLFNVLGGVRYSYRTAHRFTPYAEALAGKSKELSNYVFVENASALALSGGGGVSFVLAKHIAWNAEADYIYSQLPNAANNAQNDIRASTGVIFRFGPR